jgi:DNA-binding transcriptional ArsR family regulator
MEHADDLPRIAALIGDPARARMLWTLIDGTSRPAGELAYAASVSAQSASAHLAKLVEGGLLEANAQGRHRYFRIASAEVAGAVEALASLGAANRPRRPRARLPAGDAPPGFLHARTCYGHLAGEMAVRLLQAMVKARWLSPSGADFRVTVAGESRLQALGLDLAAARRRRRAFARACVDLTQRRPHLGGALGDALLELYVERGWVQRSRRSRVVSVTPRGEDAFKRIAAAST